jgi:hypothetical protein
MRSTVIPMHRNTCRQCLGQPTPDGAACPFCFGSGVANADAAMREHWAFGWGYRDHCRRHALGLTVNDSPYSRGSFADTCWRAGWAEADRDDIAESRREKAENERSFG